MNNESFVIDDKEISNNKEKYAYLFSEGNKELEKALLNIWDEGINTCASCAGHPEEILDDAIIRNEPYISIKFDENYDKELKLLSSIDKKGICRVSISVNNEYYMISIYSSKDKFDLLLNSINTCKYDKEDEIYSSIMHLHIKEGLSEYGMDDFDNKNVGLLDFTIDYSDGEISKVSVHTTREEVADLLKEHYEYEVINYNWGNYYQFNVSDLDFINYFNSSIRKE